MPKPNKDKKCGECGHCEKRMDRDNMGNCFRFPPRSDNEGTATVDQQSTVNLDQRACGEFE